jgi:hypothetical protein
MSIRHLHRLGAGLVAGVVALALLASPAGANTVNAEVTGGTGLTFYDENGDPWNGGPNNCGALSWDPITITTSGTATAGTIEITMEGTGFGTVVSRRSFDFTLEVTGTYNSSGTFSFTGDFVGTMTRLDASCEVTHAPCTVTSTGLYGSGTIVAANPAALTTGDVVWFIGWNDPDGVIVTGDPTACGGAISLNAGSSTVDFDLTVT